MEDYPHPLYGDDRPMALRKPTGEPPVRHQRVVRGTAHNNHKMKTGTELIAEERARQISEC